ncbi:hypothetical protein GLOTRDRAFT_56442, partial [Gloeophyllum trabeum ATCC 11539]
MSVGLMHTVSDTSPNDWHYLSEGGATLVLSYRGPSDARFNGMVLRLRKTDIRKPNSLPGNAPAKNIRSPDASVIQRECQERIVGRLIPGRYLPRLSLVGTDPDWLSQLADQVHRRRPLLRREKDAIDVTRSNALLATDLTASGSWSIEIKTRTCRYCMHSYLKSTKGEASAEGFCPLDLYSGKKERVEIALCALWDEWIGKAGHINNLKIFVDGQTLTADDVRSMEALRRAIKESSSNPHCLESAQLRDAFVERVAAVLLSSQSLGILARLQRTLDPLDIEGLTSLWDGYDTSKGNVQSNPLPAEPDPTMDDYAAFIDQYLTSGKVMDHDHPRLEDLRYYTLSYLLSATFKDCSIIVRPILFHSQDNTNQADFSGQEPSDYQDPVTFIDLDPKPIRKLRHWAKLDKEIVEAYRLSGQLKSCFEE